MNIDDGGLPASDKDIDPTHLRALADRVRVLAAILEAVKDGGEARDRSLHRIEDDVQGIRNEVDRLLKASQQFTPEQCKVLEDIVVGRGHSKWLWDRAKLTAAYAAAFATTMVAMSPLFPGISKIIKGIFQ